MSTPNDGGPAFPVPNFIHTNGETQWGHDGMSLRDWFAGQATEEDIREIRKPWPHPLPQPYYHEEYTREEKKYVYADRMLAARERKEAS